MSSDNTRIVNIEDVISRAKMFTNSKTNKELSERLGISQSDFSNRKKRNSLLPLLIEMAFHEKVNSDWLLTGEGDIRPDEVKEKNGSYQAQNGLVTVGNNNSINIHVEKRQGKDYSPDFMRLATEIICSEDEEMIRLAIAQLSAIAQLIAQKKRGG